MLRSTGVAAAFLLVCAPDVAAQLTAQAERAAVELAEAEQAAVPQDDPVFRWRDHPQLRFGRQFRIDFQAKLQYDTRRAGDDPIEFDESELRRARVGVEGEIFRRVQFALEREMARQEIDDDAGELGNSPWKDVYLDVNLADALQVRGGKFKVPFGLETLTGITNLDFVHRTLASTYLTPGRDTGIMLHGRLFDRGLNYWAGYFEHDGDNAESRSIQGADETLAARLTVTPLRWISAFERTELGGAVAVSELDNRSELPNGLRARTVISEYVFFEPVFVKGRRTRYEADIDWFAGPLGVRAELMRVVDTRRGQGLANQTLPDARARAWYVSGAWVVTGEDKERPVVPDREFLRGGAGAFELAVRFERIYFDSVAALGEPFRNPRAESILPSGNRVFTAGLNWYVNRWVRLQLHGVREQLDDEQRSPVPGRAPFWSPVVRLQMTI